MTEVAKEFTIWELATRSGVATSALRFYEERGLIHARRNASGHRRYARDVIRRVAFIGGQIGKRPEQSGMGFVVDEPGAAEIRRALIGFREDGEFARSAR